MTASKASETHVHFQGDDRLEGMLGWPDGDAPADSDAATDGATTPGSDAAAHTGVVVAHPHPLYGGTMAHPVVYRVAQSCREHGLATLRFNFRGVGESLGRYSGTEEHRDVEAAAAYLRGRLDAGDGAPDREAGWVPARGPGSVALAGYSFGSIMSARAAAGPIPIAALALVGFVVLWDGLPADTLSSLSTFRGPVLAVCAEHDDIGYPDDVDRALGDLGLDYRLEVIKGADHFLEGRQREVGGLVAEFLAGAVARRGRVAGE